MQRHRLRQVFFAALALAISSSRLHATPASPLIPTFTPAGAVSLIYQLPATPGPSASVSLATGAAAAPPATSTFYTIDPATVPIWLSVSVAGGTVTSPVTTPPTLGTPSVFTLGPSGVAARLGAGVYSGTVQVDVIGYLPLSIPVTLVIKAPLPALSALGIAALNGETWAIGAPQTAFKFSLASNNLPISYTSTLSSLVSTGTTVSSGISISPASGLVYSWGTTVSVTLSASVYAKAVAGDVLTATITINCPSASPSSITIPFTLSVLPPLAAITSLYPTAVPVDTNAADVVNVVISGSGFVAGGTGQITEVFANTALLTTGVTVINSTTIVLAINVGTTNYFAAAGTPLILAVINPNGGSPSAPTSGPAVAGLPVVSTPIVNSITSSATFLESGANATFAPYDMITIFGSNFCPDCGQGSNPSLLTGAPDPTYFRFPTSLSPDPASGTPHYLQVQFNKHTGGASIAPGYLIFANNTQINVLVPATVTTVTPSLIGIGTVDVLVSYGTTAPPAAPLGTETSTAYTVGVVANDPGVLTVNSVGVGQGAVLNSDFSLNSSTNAALHTTGTVLVFMTGLGAPNSTASNTTTATALTYPGSCISALGLAGSPGPPTVASIIGYLTTMNTTTVNPAYTAPSPLWTSLDGAVIQSAMIQAIGAFHYPPCIYPVTATVAGVTAAVSYAGWVADSLAGLYQVNLTIPTGAVPSGTPASGLTTPISVPILVTAGGKTSQAGVTLWVK